MDLAANKNILRLRYNQLASNKFLFLEFKPLYRAYIAYVVSNCRLKFLFLSYCPKTNSYLTKSLLFTTNYMCYVEVYILPHTYTPTYAHTYAIYNILYLTRCSRLSTGFEVLERAQYPHVAFVENFYLLFKLYFLQRPWRYCVPKNLSARESAPSVAPYQIILNWVIKDFRGLSRYAVLLATYPTPWLCVSPCLSRWSEGDFRPMSPSTVRCSLSLPSVFLRRPLPNNRLYMLCRSLHISSTCPNVRKNDKNVAAKIIKIFLPSKCCNTRETKMLKQKTLKNHDFSQKCRKIELNNLQLFDLYLLNVAYTLDELSNVYKTYIYSSKSTKHYDNQLVIVFVWSYLSLHPI